jgi:hypothetical protein
MGFPLILQAEKSPGSFASESTRGVLSLSTPMLLATKNFHDTGDYRLILALFAIYW